MYFLLLIIISSFLYAACAGNNKRYWSSKEELIDKDTSSYAVIRYDSSQAWNLKTGMKPASLSEEEIKDIHALLNKAVDEHNRNIKLSYQYHGVDTLKKYKKQLVPYINEKGEKEVWVNCLCSNKGPGWRKEIIAWMDGGNCYFNLTINLSLKTSSIIMVNGYG